MGHGPISQGGPETGVNGATTQDLAALRDSHLLRTSIQKTTNGAPLFLGPALPPCPMEALL